tara:strand:- start:5160 stop:6062 length:903 start_codon:yes stop_codon:yes gene_type:complete
MKSVLSTQRTGMDLLDRDAKRIAKRIKNDWDAVILNVGIPGTGKTVLSIQQAKLLCKHLGCEWDIKSMIVYDGPQFLEALANNPDETPIILDEAGSALFSQEWSNAVNKAIVKALMVVRKRRKVMILNLPKLRFLNPGVSDRISLFCSVYTYKGKRGYAAVHYPTTTVLSNYKYPYFRQQYIHLFPDLDQETKDAYQPVEMEGKEYLLNRYIEQSGGHTLEQLIEFVKGLEGEQKEGMLSWGRGEYRGMRVYSADLMAQSVDNASRSMCRAAANKINSEMLKEKGGKSKKMSEAKRRFNR